MAWASFQLVWLTLTLDIIKSNPSYQTTTSSWCQAKCSYKSLNIVCSRTLERCAFDKYHCSPEGRGGRLPTKYHREKILDKHNELKNSFASGFFGSSNISNARVMSYSTELEFLAQCWTNMCSNDKCRRTPNFEDIGQNYYIGVERSFTHSILHWFDQRKLWDQDSIIYDYSNISDFTQLLWADTYLVGCARNRLNSQQWFIVCNYYPAGNKYGSNFFKEGPPRSECPLEASKGDIPYNNLCGSILEDEFEPPWPINGKDPLQQNKCSASIGIVIFSLYCLILS